MFREYSRGFCPPVAQHSFSVDSVEKVYCLGVIEANMPRMLRPYRFSAISAGRWRNGLSRWDCTEALIRCSVMAHAGCILLHVRPKIYLAVSTFAILSPSTFAMLSPADADGQLYPPLQVRGMPDPSSMLYLSIVGDYRTLDTQKDHRGRRFRI
jgi:hypothetical protein